MTGAMLVKINALNTGPTFGPTVVDTVDPYYLNDALLVDFTGANGSTTFTDSSRWAHTLTANGSAQIQSNKLDLNGTTDWVSVTPAAYEFIPNYAFTVEAVAVEFRDASSDQCVIAHDNIQSINNGRDWRVVYYGSTATLAVEYDPSGTNAGPVSTASIGFLPRTDGTEYDIAFSFDGATVRLYVNGVFKASASATPPNKISTVQNFTIGNARESGANVKFFNGRVGAARITRGVARMTTTSVYTREARTLPSTQATTTDPYLDKTVLILYGEGANGSTAFVDHSPYDRQMTVAGAAQMDTSVSVNGTPSIKVGQTNSDFLTGIYSADLSTVGKDFTIEAYVRVTASGVIRIIMTRRTVSTTHNWVFDIDASNHLAFGLFNAGSTKLSLTGSTTLSTNTVYHCCAMRSGSTTYLFVDGVQVASGTATGAEDNTTENLVIGKDPSTASRNLQGAVNWARITIGQARYSTSGFTPPSVPLPIT